MHSYTKKESNASTFFHDFKNMPLAIPSGIFFMGFPLNSACASLNVEKSVRVVQNGEVPCFTIFNPF